MPGRRRGSRRSPASCAPCSASSPSCAARAACPSCCAPAPDPGALADGVATWAELDDERRARGARRASTSAERVQLVLDWARDHLAELQVAESIRNDVTEGVDKQQREYLLRQQLAAIRKELGEGDDDVVAEYRAKLADARRCRDDLQRDRQGDRPARADELAVARAGLDPHLARPRLRAAVGQPQRRQPRPGRRPGGARRRPLRPRRREGPHRRVHGRAQAARRARGGGRRRATDEREPSADDARRSSGRRDHHARRAARRRQDEPGRVGRPGDGPQVRARRARRHPRRGRDPRPPAHLRRLAAGPHRQGDDRGRHDEPRDPARRGRQARRRRLVGRPDRGPARGARPGPEPHVPRPLPRGRSRPVRRRVHRHRQRARHRSRRRCSTAWRSSASTATPTTRRCSSPAATCCPASSSAPGCGDGRAGRRRRHDPGRRPPLHAGGRRAVAGARARPAGPQGGGEGRRRRDAARRSTPDDLNDWLGRPKVVDDVPERTELPGVATGLAVTGAGGDVLFIETTAFPDGRRGRAGPDAHRPARRRDEGVGPDRPQLRALARRRAGHRPRVDAPPRSTSTCRPVPCPRTGRRRASR